MREILFRGKILDSGEWAREGYLTKSRDMTERPALLKHAIDFEENGLLFSTLVDSETIGQFTGLTDKNGTKIFEGDIVKCMHAIRFEFEEKERNPRRSYGGHYVKRTDYPFYYDYIYYRNYEIKFVVETCDYIMKNGADRHKLNENYSKYHELEVIGNIYDNIELLKHKDEPGS